MLGCDIVILLLCAVWSMSQGGSASLSSLRRAGRRDQEAGTELATELATEVDEVTCNDPRRAEALVFLGGCQPAAPLPSNCRSLR
jgi:hypothetical protein